jgi:hypothetical protein
VTAIKIKAKGKFRGETIKGKDTPVTGLGGP